MQNDRQKTVFQRKNKKGVLLYAILVNQPESSSDPSGGFLKMPLICCYKLYFREVSFFGFGFNLLLVANIGHNVVMQLCRVVSYSLICSEKQNDTIVLP